MVEKVKEAGRLGMMDGRDIGKREVGEKEMGGRAQSKPY